MSVSKGLVVGCLFVTIAVGAHQEANAGGQITLTPAQQERLQQIRKRLDPAVFQLPADRIKAGSGVAAVEGRASSPSTATRLPSSLFFANASAASS